MAMGSTISHWSRASRTRVRAPVNRVAREFVFCMGPRRWDLPLNRPSPVRNLRLAISASRVLFLDADRSRDDHLAIASWNTRGSTVSNSIPATVQIYAGTRRR